jgi:hypothetical protein
MLSELFGTKKLAGISLRGTSGKADECKGTWAMRHLAQSAGAIGTVAATFCAAIVLPARGHRWAPREIVLASSFFLVSQAAADPNWQSHMFALYQFDGTVTATLRIPSQAQQPGIEPNAVCVIELPGGTLPFKSLVDVLASGIFALQAELPYPYSAARPKPKPDISIQFSQLGHEIMVFYFENRSSQLGVKGRLENQSSGHYRIQANPAFLNNLRNLARTNTADRGC